MQTKVKNIGDSTLELTVELAKPELVDYIHTTEHVFGQQLSVDGFRRGKVPKDLLKKHLDQGQVLQTALQTALQDSLARFIREQELDVFQTRDLKIQENSAERLKYSIVLVVFPRVTLPDMKGFKAVRQEVAVQEKELQDAVDVIRNWRASFALKDGVAENGDRVEVDFKVSMQGKQLEGGESKSHPLIIGGKGFMPGFEEHLVGMRKGESKKFTLTAPDDYYQRHLAGKELDFEVTMNAVQRVQLPEVNDDFAKSVGKFADVEQFKTNLREGIRKEKEEKERQRVRLEILERIIGEVTIEPPGLLVDQHLDQLVANFDADLHTKGMELVIYLAHVGKTQDELRKDWRRDAVKQAKIELILRAVAREHKLQVSEQEVELALNQMVQTLVARGQADPNQLNLEDMRHHIAERLLNEQALEHIEQAFSA